MSLEPNAAAAGVRVIVHKRIGSTNTEALTLARAGERGPLWIVAGEQTAGRGRRGRRWHSPVGNLHASLLLTDPCAPERAPQLSFVAALALHDALADLHPRLRDDIRFKWPNDLLLGGAKVAGLLVEGESMPGCGLAAVIGIGVNCVAHPDTTPYPATDLRAAGFEVSVDALLAALSRRMQERLAAWARGEGFDGVRRDWTEHGPRLGEPMRVRTGESEAAGGFGGIDAEGRLILALDGGGQKTFHAAEVMPGREPPAALRASAAL